MRTISRWICAIFLLMIVTPNTAMAQGINGPEVGPDDFRISETGPGVGDIDAFSASIVYNSTEDEYLVVWAGNETLDGRSDIYGQLLDASGNEISGDFQMSNVGEDGWARYPAVIYNVVTNEYLVVWEGGLSGVPSHIYGQRLDANGNETGADDFLISRSTHQSLSGSAVAFNQTNNEYLVAWVSTTITGNIFDVFIQRLDGAGNDIGSETQISEMDYTAAQDIGVTWNSTNHEFLVIWEGSNVFDGDNEIYGQRLDATGNEVGADDFPISDAEIDPTSVSVTYNSEEDEYLVVWTGHNNSSLDTDAFGQLLDATGNQIGTNDFQISDMGPEGVDGFGATDLSVIYNSIANDYLVVWKGFETGPGGELFGQRLNENGAQIGTNDFRVSNLRSGANENNTPHIDFVNITALRSIAYNSTANEYTVVWSAEGAGNDRFEIFGQQLDAGGNKIGVDDFRISDLESEDIQDFTASDPAVAFNSMQNEYLVVWSGDDEVDGEFEVFGQLLDAAGTEIGDDFRISTMGPDGDPAFSGFSPAVIYNSLSNEYLVIWSGFDDNGTGLPQVFGQRLDTSGNEVGTDDFPISEGFATIDSPVLTFNSLANEYLVVWQSLTFGYLVFGQRLDAVGNEIGSNDFQISDILSSFNGTASVVWNGQSNEYLVAFSGNDTDESDEVEIFGQRLDAFGNEIGLDDFRISQMGPDGDLDFQALNPSVSYSSMENEYLVVWQGSLSIGSFQDDEFEIFGQRLSATGDEVGTDDFRISQMGPEGNPNWDGFNPTVSYTSISNEYLVIWHGDDDAFPLVGGEFEIFGQRLSATGDEVGTDDFRISQMGPEGSGLYDASNSAVVYNSAIDEFLTVWQGDDDTAPLVDNEIEIFGQRLSFPTVILTFHDAYGAPGGQAVMPITLDASEPITGVQFRIEPRDDGNPTTLAQFIGTINHAEHLDYDVTASTDENNITSVLLLNFSSATPLPTGENLILELFFDIDENAPLDTGLDLIITENLLTDSEVNARPHTVVTGQIRTGRPGDTSRDGDINILDIARVIRYILNILPPPTGFDLFVADANGDGDLDIRDAITMINLFLYDQPTPPAKQVIDTPAQIVTAGLGDIKQTDGQTKIPLVLTSDGTVAGLQASLTFDTQSMIIGTPELTDRAAGMTLRHHVSDGTLRLVVFSTEGEVLPPGSGTMVLIPVSDLNRTTAISLSDVVLADLMAGDIPVQLENTTIRPNDAPDTFSLQTAFPNPFNPRTTIAYSVPKQAHIRLTVYNLLGQEVIRLVDQVQTPGRYDVIWNGRNDNGLNVASGIYIYRLTSNTGYTETRRMTLLK